MPRFSMKSESNLKTCEDQLQDVLREAIEIIDFSVIEGFRSKERQEKMVEKGTSQLHWPESKHNKNPSRAVDIIPHPFQGWDHTEGFVYVAGHIMAIAKDKGVHLRWGGDWDGDDIVMVDQNFNDLPHFELVD